MSLKVFKNLQADRIFCFSKTLLSLTIIGQFNLLPCLDIGRRESLCMSSPSYSKFLNISNVVSFFSQTSFSTSPCINKFSLLL